MREFLMLASSVGQPYGKYASFMLAPTDYVQA